GAFRIGRALPLPETHQLWALGGGASWGALALDAEGAVSRHDLNAFSSLDDQDNLGQAGRVGLSLEGALPGALGAGGLTLTARAACERADATDPARRFRDGGRVRARGELRLVLPWVEPALRAESDERRTPGDTARVGERVREGACELQSAARFPWRALAGYTAR